MKEKKETIDNPNMRLLPTTENPEMNTFITKNKEIINILEKMNKCHGLRDVVNLFESFIKPKMLEYGFSSDLHKTTAYYNMTFKKIEENEKTTIKLKLNYETIYNGPIFNLVGTNCKYEKNLVVQYETKDYIVELTNKKTYIANNINEVEYFRGKDEIIKIYNEFNPNNKLNFDNGSMAIKKVSNFDHIKIDYCIDYSKLTIKSDFVYLDDVNNKKISELVNINKILKNNYEEFIKVFNGKSNNIKELCEIVFIDTDINVSKHFEKNNETFFNICSMIEKIKKLKRFYKAYQT